MAKTTDDEWTTVQEESATRIIFDTIGDQFIGTFLGLESIPHPETGEAMDYLMFRGTDGELYSTSAGYKLTEACKKVQPGQMVRITYVKEVPIGPGRNPMKDYRVDVKA